MTSIMSILHRGTGVVLSLGLFVMAWWLLAAASGPEAYEAFRRAASHPLGILFAVGLSYALFFHACTGIRHLLMDTGRAVSISGLYKSGYTALVASVVLTAVFWAAMMMGG